MNPLGHSLIAGATEPGTGTSFGSTPTYRAVDSEQLDRAVSAARAALAQPVDHEQLAAGLSAAADALAAQEESIVAVADEETALGPVRLSGELARTVGQLRMMATEARDGTRRRPMVDAAGDGPAAPALHRTVVPIGVVAVFAASNFPLGFGVAGTDTAAALAAGCPVIAKAHPAQPATAELTGRLVAEGLAAAGLPVGMFSVLHEPGYEIGQALALHDGIDAIAFTGSLRGGRALLDLASGRPRPIPVYAEMGSLNPLLVSPGAAAERPDALVEGIIGSYLLGEGQFCTKPGIVILPDTPAGAAIAEGLALRVQERPAGHRLLHDGIASAFTAAVSGLSDDGDVEIIGGPDSDTDHSCRAALVTTTPKAVLANPSLREEMFGPVTVVVQAGPAEMTEIIDALEPALTGTIHFADGEQPWVGAMVEQLSRKVGRVIANGYPTGVRVGVGQQHGGPYPATTSPLHTSVGLASIDRFQRPVTFQDFPAELLPAWAGTA